MERLKLLSFYVYTVQMYEAYFINYYIPRVHFAMTNASLYSSLVLKFLLFYQ